ncbi:MAG TPA: response regulator transcription factor [Prolixibacteraceae bacterium]|nr:response regulator transcription factor [Prolixibacteraceae bacterium]
MENKKIDIVVTDDHKLFRKGIAALLDDIENVDTILEAGNGVELLRLLENNESLPNLILLDLNMPEMDGVEATQKIRELYPDLKIIILTMEDDEQLILHLINEGINGYLNKSADPDEVELAINKVMNMDYYFPEEISKLVFSNLKKFGSDDLPQRVEFSKQEKKVLQLMCRELTNVEIGEQMEISKRTVEGYRRNMISKTGVRSMAGLIVYALKNKIVEI